MSFLQVRCCNLLIQRYPALPVQRKPVSTSLEPSPFAECRKIIYMIGCLALVNGAYAYNERICHDKPGPQNFGEEVTSNACR